ncbi:MAG: UDP-glucose/GDP-mannose dehydrogenase family protein [Vicinamibacterales bacterium]
MNVAVFGLGYVGSVSGAALADEGHSVVGVDINADKVARLNGGISPIVEPGLDELIGRTVASGRLRATTDACEAVAASDVSLVSVSTPSRKNGSLDLTHLTRVCEQIGAALRRRAAYHVVVIRSTMLPGTTHETVIPTLERCSGARYGTDFGVAVNPEFLREGSALHDLRHPPMTLVGHNHAVDAASALQLYETIDAPVVSTNIRAAEMIKYACNSWHAVKVCFANEIGSICKSLGVDSHEVMDIFCQDDKLNLSPYYLKPGFSFGGSCLPKDVRALEYRSRELDLDLPLLRSVMPSNRQHLQQAVDAIVDSGRTKVGILGLSFKAGTDDLRESPMVILAETLLGKGYQVRIFDRNVLVARLTGANKAYIEQQIPHLAALLCGTPEELIEDAELVVVGNAAPEFGDVLTQTNPSQAVLDLVRVPCDLSRVPAEYHGLCW